MSESSSLIKRDANKFFPVKFPKFWILPCFTEHFQWLLLKVSGFQPANQFRKGLLQRCFSVNFAKFLRTSFVLTEHLRETAFSCTSCKISTTRYGKKLFCTRTRRSHLKAFIFSKSYQPASFQKKKKLFYTSSFMYFFFIFSERIKIPSTAKVLKVFDIIFFKKWKRKVVLLVMYLFNYDSSKSTFFMLNMALNVLLGTDFIK